MAEELVLTVKSNIKSVTKDTEEYGKTVESAEDKLKNINGTLKEQKDILLELQKEQVRLEQAQAKMSDWEKHISGSAEGLSNLKLEIKDQRLAVKDLTMQQKDAKDAAKEFAEAQKEQGGTLLDNIKNYKVFGISLNGIKAGFKKVIPTARAMFASIKAGLISTGIGAFVVAIGSLMAYFSRTKAGSETLGKAMKVLGAVVGVLMDRLVSYWKMLYSIMTGDWEGVVSNAKDAFGGLGDEISREVELTLRLAEATNRLIDAERDLKVEMAERRAEIEELKLAADDLSLTEEERLSKMNEAAAIETKLMADRVANAEEALRIQQMQMTMSDNMKEDLDDLAEKEIALANIRRESAKMQRTIQTKLNRIKQQSAAAEQKRQNEWIRKQNEITRANMKLKEEANEIVEELYQRGLATQEERDKRILFMEFSKQEEIIEKSKLNELDKFKALKLLATKYETEKQEITDKYDKEAEEKKQALADKLQAIENETMLLAIKNAREREAEEMKIAEETELKAVEGLDNQLELEQAIRDKYAALRKEKNDQEAEEDKARAQEVAAAKVDVLKQGLEVVGNLMDLQSAQIEKDYKKEIKLAEANGKSTEKIEKKFEAKRREQAKKMKAMKIAMAIVDTYQSAVSAYAAGMSVGGPVGLVLGPVSAGLAVIAGLANVAMIEKQPLGDGGGGGGGGGGPSPAGANPPAPQMMSGQFSLENTTEPEPLQAYVVTDEMTNSQNQLANIRRRSTI